MQKYNYCDLVDQDNQDKQCVIIDLQRQSIPGQALTTQGHKHTFYQIFFVTSGTGTNFIDYKNHEIQKGDIFFIAPGQIHKWTLNNNTQGFVINFSQEFFNSFLKDNNFLEELAFFKIDGGHSVLNVSHNLSTYTNIFEKVYYETQLTSGGNNDLIKVYLLELLLLCQKQINQSSSYDNRLLQPSNLVKQFEVYIEKHFYEYRFPKEYAQMLYVTPNYLNAVCQKVKGISAGEVIRNRILLESKRLLVNTNLSASEVAYKLSFKDNSYFSRFFKKYVGISPDEYRRA
ncbi:helix-turn-helix domain-containing protein [Myroides sp. LJL116]